MRIAAAVITAAGVFLVDTITPLQSAVAVLYVLVLVIIDDGRSRGLLLAAAAGSEVLAVISFLLTHRWALQVEPILRLLVGVAAIAVTALIIDRKQAMQAAAQASDRRYRTIFDTLAVAIWEHDFRDVKRELDGLQRQGVEDLRAYLADHPEFVIRMRQAVRITDANETALKLLNVPTREDFFARLSDFLPEEDDSFPECLMAMHERRSRFETETQVRTRTGEPIDVLVALSFPPDGTMERICASILDVSERKKVQAALDDTRVELDRAVRAATVGELSASIAHEVSQPLSAVRAYTEAARRWLVRTPPDPAEALAAMEEAARGALRASQVIDRVRQLISRNEPVRVPVKLADVLAGALTLCQRELAAARVEVNLPPSDVVIRGDQVLLQQLFVNLLNNAAQAMERAASPKRHVRLSGTAEGNWVTVTIRDTGPGFSPQASERAFSPFFSERSHGVGLGLSMCRSIVEAQDGTIAIASEELGVGATVVIRLPAA